MSILYNISIYLLNTAIYIAALFCGKPRSIVKGRYGMFRRIDKAEFAKSARVVWVHCASLGEFEQGRSIIEHIKRREPQTKILLTFFSPSGYEVRKNYSEADYICYLPADTPFNARRFVNAYHPDVAIFVKYEYWYNFLRELRRSGAKSYVVSAIFRPDMRFFSVGGAFFRNMLKLVDHFFVQNDESAKLLASIGITSNVTVAGDTRFDRVADIVSKAPRLPIVEEFAAGATVVVCGSTWAPDIDILLPLMGDYPQIKFIIAPHELHEYEIERLISMSERPVTRYTQKSNPDATLMVVDCIGILSGVYAYGDIAYIGGGFGNGIHNILEAATWGLPVIFGPKYQKFAEACDLIALGGAFSVGSYDELSAKFRYIMDNRAEISTIPAEYVKDNTGATEIVLNTIAIQDVNSVSVNS